MEPIGGDSKCLDAPRITSHPGNGSVLKRRERVGEREEGSCATPVSHQKALRTIARRRRGKGYCQKA